MISPQNEDSFLTSFATRANLNSYSKNKSVILDYGNAVCIKPHYTHEKEEEHVAATTLQPPHCFYNGL